MFVVNINKLVNILCVTNILQLRRLLYMDSLRFIRVYNFICSVRRFQVNVYEIVNVCALIYL